MDCESVNNPALTKLTTITVVEEEDCTSAVISTPVNTPVTLLVVICLLYTSSHNLSPSLISIFVLHLFHCQEQYVFLCSGMFHQQMCIRDRCSIYQLFFSHSHLNS